MNYSMFDAACREGSVWTVRMILLENDMNVDVLTGAMTAAWFGHTQVLEAISCTACWNASMKDMCDLIMLISEGKLDIEETPGDALTDSEFERTLSFIGEILVKGSTRVC